MFVRSLIISAIILTVVPTSTAHPPLVFRGADGQCAPSPEICGDGIDQDCDGKDALCPGNDKDFDGFPDHADCDDTDRWVYPGISVACDVNGAAGTKTCQNNGTYTACTTTPLCEAKGGGRCYYVSSTSGKDSNPGTYSLPWKTVRNFYTYYNWNERPSGWRQLQAGDVVYFIGGNYSDVLPYNNDRYMLIFRAVKNPIDRPIQIKAYPGTFPVFQPPSKERCMYFEGSEGFIVEGIKFTGCWEFGIKVAGGSQFEFRNVWIDQTDGIHNDNIAGFHSVNAEKIFLNHSVLNDNFDKTNSTTGGQKRENSRNAVFFGGGNIRVSRSVIFHTPPVTAQFTGSCMAYKHAATVPDSIFEVDHNFFYNCWANSIGSGTSGTRIHHNLILNSFPVVIKDFGGYTSHKDIQVYSNTFVNGIGLEYNPTDQWTSVGQLSFTNNIVTDTIGYGNERGMLTISTYGSDQMFLNITGNNLLTVNNNCYYNPNHSPRWAMFAAGFQYGPLGALYDWHGWRGLGYDQNSSVVDPILGSNLEPKNPSCVGKGFR